MAGMSKQRVALLAGVALVVVAGGAGAAWYVRGHDPLNQGRALQQRGELRAAALELRTAVRNHPENAEAHWRLGTVLLGAGDPIAAEKELNEAAARGFDRAALTLPLAQAALEQQHFAEMLKDFPPDRAAPAQRPQLLVLRASAQLGAKDEAGAQASVDEAAKLAPQSAEVAFAAARVAAARRDLATADRELDRSLALNPHSAGAHYMKAELANQRNDRVAALAELDRALEDAPKMQQARFARANLLMLAGQDARARADVDAILADNPKDPIGTYMNGVLLLRARDYQGADRAFQQISPMLARIPRGYFFEAMIKSSIGQNEQALDAATRYAARAPGDLAGIKLLAQLQMGAQRPDRAVETLSRATAAGVQDAQSLDMLGRAYAQAGRAGEAVNSFERASSLAPRNSEILTRLASAKLGAGDANGAAADFARSLELAPNAVETGERAVAAALAAGDVERAQAALERMRAAHADPIQLGLIDASIKTARLDYPAARAALDGVLAADPKSVPARIGIARIAQLQGQPAEAERALREALQAAPTAEAPLAALLGLLLNAERVPDAVRVAADALAAEPGNATLAVLFSDLAIRTGDPKRGLAALDALPKDRAALPAAMAARARLQAAMGKPADAKQTYAQILKANPGDVAIRREQVALLVSTGELDAARNSLHEALAASPGNPGLLNASVMLAGQANGVDAALAEADDLARDPANAPASAALRGNALAAANRYDDAAAAYARALKATPSTTLAIDTATALNTAGKTGPALQTLRDWVAANPADVFALSALAGFEIAARKSDEALPHLETVLAARPSDPSTLNNLAWIYQQRGDKRALAYARKSYILAPTPQTADTLGWILVGEGQAQAALPLLAQALAALKNDPAVAYHYAVALKSTGHDDDAVKLLRLLVAAPEAYDDKPAARKLLDELAPGGK